jgi:hypothetical protein
MSGLSQRGTWRVNGYLCLYLLVALLVLVRELISGCLTTTWDYLISDLDSTTTGVIIESGPGWYRARSQGTYDIRFAYTVDGRRYIGDQIDFDARDVKAREKIQTYPEGRMVEVHYDSERPQYSALEKKPLGRRIFVELACGAAFFLLVWLGTSSPLVQFIANRSAAPEMAGQARFPYRIPILYRVLTTVILGLLALAEQGYLEEYIPSGYIFKPLFTIAFFVVGFVMVFSPYRDSFLEFHEDHLVLPSLFVPPFRNRVIKYADILRLQETTDDNAYSRITVVLKDGKVKISSHFCYGKTMLTLGSPDEYYHLRDVLHARLEESQGPLRSIRST